MESHFQFFVLTIICSISLVFSASPETLEELLSLLREQNRLLNTEKDVLIKQGGSREELQKLLMDSGDQEESTSTTTTTTTTTTTAPPAPVISSSGNVKHETSISVPVTTDGVGGPIEISHSPQAGQTYQPQAGLTYQPQAGPTYPPQAGLTYPPQAGPTYPPQAGPTYPPQVGPTYPPQAGPTYPPQAGPTYPYQAGPTYPPQAGPTYPHHLRPAFPLQNVQTQILSSGSLGNIFGRLGLSSLGPNAPFQYPIFYTPHSNTESVLCVLGDDYGRSSVASCPLVANTQAQGNAQITQQVPISQPHDIIKQTPMGQPARVPQPIPMGQPTRVPQPIPMGQPAMIPQKQVPRQLKLQTPEALPNIGDLAKNPLRNVGKHETSPVFVIGNDGTVKELLKIESVDKTKAEYLTASDVKYIIESCKESLLIWLVDFSEAVKQVSALFKATRDQYLKFRTEAHKVESLILSSYLNCELILKKSTRKANKKVSTNIMLSNPKKSVLENYKHTSTKKLKKTHKKRSKLLNNLIDFLEFVVKFDHLTLCSCTGIDEARRSLKKMILILIEIVKLDMKRIENSLIEILQQKIMIK
ncbi:hypothetical protein FG386_002139 [Cryptosporidium ryanae]|uniref:uncharacterized protein n=1 Tax=Cryptosporidium ryanae TaxID=515981 RepID=UPI00351A20EC|nr:hypothetical protein FG386_002139 [Cryptosporidium ryanae]